MRDLLPSRMKSTRQASLIVKVRADAKTPTNQRSRLPATFAAAGASPPINERPSRKTTPRKDARRSGRRHQCRAFWEITPSAASWHPPAQHPDSVQDQSRDVRNSFKAWLKSQDANEDTSKKYNFRTSTCEDGSNKTRRRFLRSRKEERSLVGGKKSRDLNAVLKHNRL